MRRCATRAQRCTTSGRTPWILEFLLVWRSYIVKLNLNLKLMSSTELKSSCRTAYTEFDVACRPLGQGNPAREIRCKGAKFPRQAKLHFQLQGVAGARLVAMGHPSSSLRVMLRPGGSPAKHQGLTRHARPTASPSAAAARRPPQIRATASIPTRGPRKLRLQGVR